MARRRWYRRYPRVVAAKKKWASNIKINNVETGDQFRTLAVNDVGTTVPTPVILKTGNFKVQGDVFLDQSSTGGIRLSATIYLVYLPEGFMGTGTIVPNDYEKLITAHPEYILGWTVADLGYTSATSDTNGSKFSITSRLKRNLNSGDAVGLLLLQSNYSHHVRVDFTAQFFTCAN